MNRKKKKNIHPNSLKKSPIYPHNPYKANKNTTLVCTHTHLAIPTNTQSNKSRSYSHPPKEGHTHSNTNTATQKCHRPPQAPILTKECKGTSSMKFIHLTDALSGARNKILKKSSTVQY